MNKCSDKFCPDCGHHLYTVTGFTEQGEITYKGVFFCADCNRETSEPMSLTDVIPLRAAYDPAARAESEVEL